MRILNEKETSILVRLYNEQPLTVDKLAYTPTFDQMLDDFNEQCPGIVNATHKNLWDVLMRLRKGKHLMRKTKSKTKKAQDA